MGRMKPWGKRALMDGPQAQLAWRYAGRPATAAAQRAAAKAWARRTALKHADTVLDGGVVKVFDHGEVHWVVFSAETPVASYPPARGELATLVAHADLSKKLSAEEFRERRAALPKARRALDAAADLRTQLRHRREPPEAS
jgi:hypothetical protein